MQKKNLQTIMVMILLEFLIFSQNFLSPKVEPGWVNSNKHGIYEFHHELPRDFRLSILVIRKYQENLETSYNYSLADIPPLEIKILSILAKNS